MISKIQELIKESRIICREISNKNNQLAKLDREILELCRSREPDPTCKCWSYILIGGANVCERCYRIGRF